MLNGTKGCNPQNSECGKFGKIKDPVSSTNEIQILKEREKERNKEWGLYQF